MKSAKQGQRKSAPRAERGKRTTMKAITLRQIPPALERVIRKKAVETGSINRAVLVLLEEAAGLGTKKKGRIVHHDLDSLAGAWTAKEAADFDRALDEQRSIDPEVWK